MNIWEKYFDNPNISNRNIVAQCYLSLCKKIAKKQYKKYSGYAELGDIEGYAYIGLIKAIEKYDKTKSKFETFATKIIRTEIINGLREMDNLTRNMIVKKQKLNKIAEQEKKTNKKYTDEEKAKMLKIKVKTYKLSELSIMASNLLYLHSKNDKVQLYLDSL